jgi:hypothetical protein
MDIYAFCLFLIDAGGVRYAASRLSSDIIMAITTGRNSGHNPRQQLSVSNHFKIPAVPHSVCHYLEKDGRKVNSRLYFLLLIFPALNKVHLLAFVLRFLKFVGGIQPDSTSCLTELLLEKSLQ